MTYWLSWLSIGISLAVVSFSCLVMSPVAPRFAAVTFAGFILLCLGLLVWPYGAAL